MPAARWFGLAAVVLSVVWLSFQVMTAKPDANVPGTLGNVLEPARDQARGRGGVLALIPFRFVTASCSLDGRVAAMEFESAIGSVRTYAIIGFPAASDAQSPGAVITIVGVTADEFAASPDGFSLTLVEPCYGPS